MWKIISNSCHFQEKNVSHHSEPLPKLLGRDGQKEKRAQVLFCVILTLHARLFKCWNQRNVINKFCLVLTLINYDYHNTAVDSGFVPGCACLEIRSVWPHRRVRVQHSHQENARDTSILPQWRGILWHHKTSDMHFCVYIMESVCQLPGSLLSLVCQGDEEASTRLYLQYKEVPTMQCGPTSSKPYSASALSPAPWAIDIMTTPSTAIISFVLLSAGWLAGWLAAWWVGAQQTCTWGWALCVCVCVCVCVEGCSM